MSKKAKTTVIGAFVVGAVALAVVAVLIFGSGKFLKKSITYVVYFDGSIAGLNVGAPVVFRGVEVGSVTDIQVVVDPGDMSVRIPVLIELEPDRITRVSGKSEPRKNLELLVERGLKAQLQLQSLVTGQLMVAFDLHPDKPIRYVGVDDKYPELPTIPTSLQEISKTIENLPIDELFKKLLLTVEGMEKVVNSPELLESVGTLNQTLKDLQILLHNVDKEVKPLTSTIKETSEAAKATLEQADRTLYLVEDILAEDSEPRHELVTTLKELSAAARSIRALADYLERHPEALIHGKGGDKGGSKND